MSTDNEDRLLNAKEVAEMLGVEVRTVWRMRTSRAMPKPVKFVGNTRWEYRIIRDWIDRGCPGNN